MSESSATALPKPPPPDPWDQLEQIERRICSEFSHRVDNFRIQAFEDGLVLEGRTKNYYSKQSVLQAVKNATELPILADRIVVD